MIKRTMPLAAAALLSLAASACTTAQEPASEACLQDEFGCVEIGPGQPIRLGALLSISGNTAFLGNDSVAGVQLAIDNLDGTLDGQDGQLLDRNVTVQAEDDLCSADGGQAGGTRLAADDSIVAVIGTTCSSSALGVADRILSDQGILLVSPSNTNPNLTAEGTHQDFYARTAHNDKIQGAIVAEFAYNELEARTAATINDESPYADALAAVFRQNFEALGGTIVEGGVEAVQSSDTDFKPILTRLAQEEPDILYYPNFNPACALIARQGRGIAGFAETSFVGSDGCLDSSYLDTAGAAANGTYASGPDFSGLEATNTFYREEFLPAYNARTGGRPTAAFHAHAYDAANMLFEAIRSAAITEEDTLFIPRTALRDALFATSGFQGLTGTITCEDTGDCAGNVTIALYEAPGWPVDGGDEDAEAVYSDTKTLADVS